MRSQDYQKVDVHTTIFGVRFDQCAGADGEVCLSCECKIRIAMAGIEVWRCLGEIWDTKFVRWFMICVTRQ